MNTLVFVGILVLAAAANASLLAPTTKILQGPSSSTTIVGPDGSAISAVHPGGAVVTQDAFPVVAKVGYTPLAHSYEYIAPLAHAYAAPLAQTYASHLGAYGEKAIVAGPSGTITRGYGYYEYPHQYYL